MEKLIDLHTHSAYSDGKMTPNELVFHARESSLAAIALTDHDTAAGVKEAIIAGKRYGVEVISGIELSAESKAETHILGYFIDPDNCVLNSAIRKINEVRITRMDETCALLRNNGIDVTLGEVKEKAAGGSLCRAHIAKIMTEKGYTSTPSEAFELWLSPGTPAYSHNQAITDEEAIDLIRSAGGDAYLAHINRCKMDENELDGFIKRLVGCGLCGIEAYYTEYSKKDTEFASFLATRYGLKISGGTDFHGANKPHIKIGKGLGDMAVPYSVLERLKDRKGKQ